MMKQLANIFSRRLSSAQKPEPLSPATKTRIVQLYSQRLGAVPLPILSRSPDNVLVLISKEIRSKMLLAYGRHSLVDSPMKNQADEFFHFVQASTDAEFFDFIELIFQTETYQRHAYEYVQPHELVEDINAAFEMEAEPYKLTALTVVSSGQNSANAQTQLNYPRIIRSDETAVTELAIEPALSALASPEYAASDSHFRQALLEYRKGQHEDAARNSGNALEAALKVLYRQTASPTEDVENLTIGQVINQAVQNAGVPSSLTQPILQIANIRNTKSNAHSGKTCTPEIAEYAIGAAASAIVLLVKSNLATKAK